MNTFRWLIFSDLLQCFSVAYQSKMLAVPFDWLKQILLYHSIDQLAEDLKYYGLVENTQVKCLNFQRDSFQAAKTIVSLSNLFDIKF